MQKRYHLSFLLILAGFLNLQSQSSCLSFFIESESAVPGDTVSLDVRVNGANDLLSMSYALFWNPDELDFQGIDYGTVLPGFSENNFNLSPTFTDEGRTTMSWFNQSTLIGLDLPDSTVIFSLKFEVLASNGAYAGVRFGETATTIIEFTDSDTELYQNYSLLGGGVGVGIASPAAFEGACINFGTCDLDGSIQPVASGSGLSYNWLLGDLSVGSIPVLDNASAGRYELEVEDNAGTLLHGILQLLPDNAPYISDYSATPVQECSGTPGSISVTPAGGNGFYTFNWSNGENTPEITNLTMGSYTLTLTDGTGCSYTAAYQVETSDTSNFLTAFSQACTLFPPDSSTVDLTCAVWDGGTPPYTFDWNTGYSETDSLRSILQDAPGNGTYTVTITDAAGCTHIPEAVTVDCLDDGGEDPGPCDFITGVSQECTLFSDDSSTVDISIAVWEGGTPPYTFEWSTGFTETSNSLSQLTGVPGQGVYSVTITDNDTCTYVPDPILVNCTGSNNSPLLSAAQNSVSSGAQVCVDISLNTLMDFKALEADISWDPALLEFDRVESALINFVDGQIDSSLLSSGTIGIDWSTDVPEGVSIGGEEVLFRLCYDAIGSAGSISSIEFGSNVQLTDLLDNTIPLDTQNGAVFIQGDVGDVTLSLGEASVNAGESLCLPITVQNFTDISSMQFSLDWDPTLLSFEEIELGDLPGVSASLGVNYNIITEGKMSFLWFDPQSNVVSLPDGAVLFYLCFNAQDDLGTASVVFTNDPTPVEVNDLQNNLPVQLNPGNVYIQQGDVWPGDTDTDQTVSPEDLLNIGLAYGAAGPTRPGATIEWTPQFADVWDQRTPVSQTDYKHIDTNGDGFIDGLDTLAIVQNMGESNNLAPTDQDQILRSTGVPLYIKSSDTLQLGQPAILDIVLGETSLPADNVYGIAFTIAYDSAVVVSNSARATFTNSWLGNVNNDMLTLQRNRPNDNRLDIALTRTDGINQSGSGAIGQLHITIQDVIFMRSEDYLLELSIEDVRIISAEEALLPVTTPITTTVVEETPVGTFEADQNQQLTVFPLPAQHQLWVRSESPVERMHLIAADGRVLLRSQATNQLDISHLPAGWYTLRVWTKQGLVNRLVLIQ
ncbi:MAG: hypothetical protein GVY26_07600 [Bacteroidetes bacterium]|nr:hypothetical protein [Bacteroidota bacterium]